MHARSAAATALLTASLTGLAVSTYLYLWPGTAPAPRWLPAPAPAAIVPRPAFPETIRSVEVEPRDTLARDDFVGYGRILVGADASGGKRRSGVGVERAARFGHYDLAGESLRKSFLKSPLEFTRITSGFTYARPHPILGGVRPHLAIDYGAPVGTPVRAVADGVVVHAGWNGGNGIQVHLRHRSGYETQYNHLSRIASDVRPGTRVRQRDVIGYVGMTGLATGPHLDYRVSRHGQFVNPLSEKFIPGEPLAGAD